MLGFLHPDELLQALTAQQWAEWLEFYALEPWGPHVDDLRHGLLCSAILTPHMKAGATAEPRLFMLHPPEEPELTPEQTVAHFRAALGGQTKKKA